MQVLFDSVLRGLFYFILCLLFLSVMAFGVFVCLMGFEAVSTGANPGPWWMLLLSMVVVPFIGLVFCARRLLRLNCGVSRSNSTSATIQLPPAQESPTLRRAQRSNPRRAVGLLLIVLCIGFVVFGLAVWYRNGAFRRPVDERVFEEPGSVIVSLSGPDLRLRSAKARKTVWVDSGRTNNMGSGWQIVLNIDHVGRDQVAAFQIFVRDIKPDQQLPDFQATDVVDVALRIAPGKSRTVSMTMPFALLYKNDLHSPDSASKLEVSLDGHQWVPVEVITVSRDAPTHGGLPESSAKL